MPVKERTTVEAFLALPETKPYRELIAGEVVEKAMPNRLHSRTVSRLLQALWNYFDRTGEGEAETELRRADVVQEWVYLPDVSVTLSERLSVDQSPGRGPVAVSADFAIEVLSPEDRPGRVLQRVDFYLRSGTRLLWVIDPDLDLVTIYEPGHEPRGAQPPATIDATPVLRDFRLDLADFFAAVHGQRPLQRPYTACMPVKERTTVDAFLALPETKPYRELIAGEVVEKAMPNASHSQTVGRLIQRLWNYLDKTREGKAETELRHADAGQDWVYLPDVSVTLAGRRPVDPALEHGPVLVPPDFAIEVLSPDDRAGRLSQRVDFYLRSGTRLVWVIDPEIDLVTSYEPGREPRVAQAPAVIDATPVLREFRLDLADFFAAVHGEARPS
ncbi:MAG: Uma2 family endonuclease [Chloroflexi bacterium]|nr:Uma2 family endonuclease [Chloroflexota bacterium]